MTRSALLLCLLLSCLPPLHAATVERVEPENWWVGMRHRQVELMLHGQDIAALQARIAHPGVRVTGVQALDSPNYLFVTALRKFHRYYGDDFRVECPTGSGVKMSLAGVADERLLLVDSARPDSSQLHRERSHRGTCGRRFSIRGQHDGRESRSDEHDVP